MHYFGDMSEKDEGATLTDLPLDFTQFLSGRLGLGTSATLSELGSYLLSFEARGEYSSRVGAVRSRCSRLYDPHH